MCCVLEVMWSDSIVNVFVSVVVSGVFGSVRWFSGGFCVLLLSSALVTSVCERPSRLAISSGELRSSCSAS